MTLTLGDLPSVETADLYADPLGVAERLRPADWAARTPDGCVVVSYEACDAVYRNEDLIPSIARVMAGMGIDVDSMAGPGSSLLLTEGDQHTRLRRVVSRWFTPSRVGVIRELVRARVQDLVAPISEAGGGDFMTEVAQRVPGPVFCWLIGADPVHGDRLFEMTSVLLKGFSGDPAYGDSIAAMSVEMGAFVEEVIASKRAQPGDDVLSIMLAAADEGEIRDADVHTLAFEMLSASTDNTARSAAQAVALLAERPDQWALLAGDLALAPGAVEECARVAPTVRLGGTYATAPTRVLDLEIPEGSTVVPDLIGAHYDPAVYPDPHRFDITRVHARPQLNFGTGRHYCLGAALARMEGQVILEVIASHWADLELAGAVDRDKEGAIVHLPVACVPAGAVAV